MITFLVEVFSSMTRSMEAGAASGAQRSPPNCLNSRLIRLAFSNAPLALTSLACWVSAVFGSQDALPHRYPPPPAVLVHPVNRARCGNAAVPNAWSIPFVEPGTRFKDIAVAEGYSIAVTTSGEVISWGRLPEFPALPKIRSVTADTSSAWAVSEEGRVFQLWAYWGNPSQVQPMPGNLDGVIQIVARAGYITALRTSGTVVTWGEGIGDRPIPVSASNIVSIDAGFWHAMGLRRDGSVVSWASRPDKGTLNEPALTDTRFVGIGAGMAHSLGIRRDGTVLAWGAPAAGRTAVPAGLSNVVSVTGGRFHSFALTADGTLVSWGNDLDFGQETIPAAATTNILKVATCRTHTLALRRDGYLVGWGQNNWGESTVPSDWQAVTWFSTVRGASIALNTNGHLFQIRGPGLLDLNSVSNALAVTPQIFDAHQTNRGPAAAAILRRDGRVQPLIERGKATLPVPDVLTNIVAISTTVARYFGVRADGSVVCWHGNTWELLPAPADFTNAVDVACGENFSVVLRRDGTLGVWGYLPSNPPNVPLPENLSDGVEITAGKANERRVVIPESLPAACAGRLPLEPCG